MKRSKNILAVALLSLVALYGCTTASDEETADEGPEQTEDELILRRGNVDHAAIVESTTMMLAPGPTDRNNDSYNQEDPFAIRGSQFKAVYLQRLAMFDAQDGEENWTAAQKDAWATRMATANYQVIDTSKPCGDFDDPHTYLEIERSRFMGRPHTTCGGRQPNEDALDVTVNFLIRGPGATDQDEDALHDGVEQATQKSVPTFPYLAEMNGPL